MSGEDQKQHDDDQEQRDLEDIEKKYAKIDKNGTGKILRSELKNAMIHHGYGPTHSILEKEFAKYDLDGNGSISKAEFIEVMLKKKKYAAALEREFASFDTNKDGFLTPQELKAGVAKLGDVSDADVEAAIKEADKDGDGRINFSEFAKFWAGVH
jgi:Ca2+-binding EF-hand superfamily protein